MVVDIDSTVQSIQRAVEEAEQMAGCEIRSVYAGISGSHLRCHNSDGTVAIRDQEVSAGDVERVLEAARALPIPADQRLLYVEPQEFVIDGQEGIRHPVGMSGVRLEAKVHLVTGASSAALNIGKCVARCGLAVDDLVPQPVASSLAALTQDERDLGVCLVDIGAGTTDVAIFAQGALRHTASLPIAGDQVTNDIAVALPRRRPTPRRSRSVMPAPWPSSPRRGDDPGGEPSTTRHARGARRPWRTSSSLVTRSCSAWCRRSCAAPVTRTWSPPVWC